MYFKKLTNLLPLIILINIIVPSCAGRADIEYITKDNYSSQEYLTIWSMSDIQPRDRKERIYFERAVDDIIENFNGINLSITAGDIVNWSTSQKDYEWYNRQKKRTDIKYWFEIAGNHDQKCIDGYCKYINLPLDYSVNIGNILILFMSDEKKTAAQEISDAVFEWWKNMVINNQGKIIITVTHAYLKESRMLMTAFPSRNIKDSYRFADVMKKYRVDLWICGHAHLSHIIGSSIGTSEKLNGTLFINTSAIRAGNYTGPESFLLFFKENSDDLIIKSRDHEKHIFNLNDTLYKLSKKFIWDNSVPVMKPAFN